METAVAIRDSGIDSSRIVSLAITCRLVLVGVVILVTVALTFGAIVLNIAEDLVSSGSVRSNTLICNKDQFRTTSRYHVQ